MHRRYENINIPTEVIRTIVTVVDTGSYSKAGQKLGLSQPAISAQIKRAQAIVGQPIFTKASGSVALSELGQLVVGHARRLLDANDQIIALGSSNTRSSIVRVGISRAFAERFISLSRQERSLQSMSVTVGASGQLSEMLSKEFLDVICTFNATVEGQLVDQWDEPFVWVRSNDFVVSPGAPIPLVTSLGSMQPVARALENANLKYRIALCSVDQQVRIAAVQAGLGLMAMPERNVTQGLVVAREYYLPALSAARVAIVARHDLERKRGGAVVQLLKQLRPEGVATARQQAEFAGVGIVPSSAMRASA